MKPNETTPRRYSHWLDAEYHLLADDSGLDGRLLRDQCVKTIKLFALFGNDLMLSDIQILESWPILFAFSDLGFRDFLREDPDFLQLIARPGNSGSCNERFNIATAGLARTLQTTSQGKRGWISSTHRDSELVQRLAEAVLKEGWVRTHDMLDNPAHLISRLTRDLPTEERDLLRGSLAAMQYFIEDSPASMTRSPQSGLPHKTMYTVLEESFEVLRRDINSDAIPEVAGLRAEALRSLAHIQSALEFIQDNVTSDAVHYRSALVEAARTKSVAANQAEQLVIFSARATAASAWNTAIQHSLGAAGGSIERLPHSAAPGFYLDRLADYVYLKPTGKLEQHRPKLANFGGKHPLASTMTKFIERDAKPILSWRQISKIVRETRETREQLQRARGSQKNDDIASSFEAHARAVASHVVNNRLPSLPDGLLALVGAPVGVVAAQTFSPGNEALGAAVGTAAGQFVSGVINKPWEFLRQEELLARETVVVNTLGDEYARAMGFQAAGYQIG